MSRQEIFALKLQMGIDPSARIDPNVLLTMWQQLQLESKQARSNRSEAAICPDRVTTTPMVV